MAKPFFWHKGGTAPAPFIDPGTPRSRTINRNHRIMWCQNLPAERCEKLILTIAGHTRDAHSTRHTGR
jgi:hypothetical protein